MKFENIEYFTKKLKLMFWKIYGLEVSATESTSEEILLVIFNDLANNPSLQYELVKGVIFIDDFVNITVKKKLKLTGINTRTSWVCAKKQLTLEILVSMILICIDSNKKIYKAILKEGIEKSKFDFDLKFNIRHHCFIAYLRDINCLKRVPWGTHFR